MIFQKAALSLRVKDVLRGKTAPRGGNDIFPTAFKAILGRFNIYTVERLSRLQPGQADPLEREKGREASSSQASLPPFLQALSLAGSLELMKHVRHVCSQNQTPMIWLAVLWPQVG